MKKIKIYLVYIISFILVQPKIVDAAGTPTFDTGGAQAAANGFLTPLMDFALWAIPIITGVVWVVTGLMWQCKDEDEKEQKPFVKTSKRIIIVGIVCECVPTFLKIFGIS